MKALVEILSDFVHQGIISNARMHYVIPGRSEEEPFEKRQSYLTSSPEDTTKGILHSSGGRDL